MWANVVKGYSTFSPVIADTSKKGNPHDSANLFPSADVTTLFCKSDLFAMRTTGIPSPAFS